MAIWKIIKFPCFSFPVCSLNFFRFPLLALNFFSPTSALYSPHLTHRCQRRRVQNIVPWDQKRPFTPNLSFPASNPTVERPFLLYLDATKFKRPLLILKILVLFSYSVGKNLSLVTLVLPELSKLISHLHPYLYPLHFSHVGSLNLPTNNPKRGNKTQCK